MNAKLHYLTKFKFSINQRTKHVRVQKNIHGMKSDTYILPSNQKKIEKFILL